ncbi:MAG: hypothetical protein KC643_21540 [Nitrospira sp.]|nr:hypothetical protein [Nitrospira sp.]
MGWREYYLKWFRFAFNGPWGYADSLAGALAILGSLLARFNSRWEPALVDLGWQIPLAVFIGLTGWRIAVAPYWMHKEVESENQRLKEEARAEREVNLEILFDDTQSSYATPIIKAAGHGRTFRVCIRNKSMKSAENVSVKLTGVAPCPEAMGYLPVILRLKDTDEPCASSFKINSQDSEFIDVVKVHFYRVHNNREKTFKNEACFHFCSAHKPFLNIPIKPKLADYYTITVQVTGEGLVGDSRKFLLGKKEGDYFMEIFSNGELKQCPEANI